MAQGERFVTGSDNSGRGGGRSNNNNNNNERSKNSKQNKIPQRGLGVAQLEKIRVEQQRKEALQVAHASANNAIGDPIQSPNANPRSNVISSPGVESPYRLAGTNMKPMVNEEESGGWPRLWNDNRFGFVHHHQFHNVDRQWQPNAPGLAVAGGGPQRGHQFQRPPSSSVSGISPSSVSSSQSEPPSIQSVLNYTLLLPDDDKIVGMKRPYPFSLGSPPPTTPPPPFLPGHFHPRSRSADEFPSFSIAARNNKCIIRDGPSNSTPMPEQNQSENVRLSGDFLTLAPPVADSPPLSSNNDSRSLSSKVLSSNNDSRSLSSKEKLESNDGVGRNASKEEHVFCFFPTKSQAEQSSRNGNGETGEKIDLNLKL